MRDWGYGLKKSIEQRQRLTEKSPSGGFMEKTPEALAIWVGVDSRALSKVSDDDLIDELQVRLLENGSLPASFLYEKIAKSIDRYNLHIKED